MPCLLINTQGLDPRFLLFLCLVTLLTPCEKESILCFASTPVLLRSLSFSLVCVSVDFGTNDSNELFRV